MSNDPNVWQAGSFFDGSGIEIRKDSKKFTQSNGSPYLEATINSRSNGKIIGSIFYSTTNNVLASLDGSLSNYFFNEQNYGRYYISPTNLFYNLLEYKNYGVVITNNTILRWWIDTSNEDLGLLASNIVDNWEFNATWTWSVGTGWTIAWGEATHAGADWVLSQVVTTEATTTYIINISSSVNSWTCTVDIAGTSIILSTSTNGTVQTFSYTTVGAGTPTISFTASSFSGYIERVKVQKSNVVVAVTGTTFNTQSPVLTIGNEIHIGNGNEITSIDITTTTWTASTTVTIDHWYTIVGLTKIGDQIFIYASNGAIGKQYLWDWTTLAPTRSITWYDKPIQRVINFNNIDYIVVKTANRTSLWMVNGYQPQLICQSNFIYWNNDKFSFNASYINSFETIGTKFLIPGENGYIYSYGNLYPWFPQSILREFEFESGAISSMNYSESVGFNIYIFYTSTKDGTQKNYSNSIYINDEATSVSLYNPSIPWSIIENPIYCETFSSKWGAKKKRIGYNMTSGQKINCYSKVNKGQNVANLYAMNVTVAPTIGSTYGVYTVYAVTRPSTTNAIILHCTYTWVITAGKYTSTITKTTGIGDSSIILHKIVDKFKLIHTITDYNETRDTFTYETDFNKIQFSYDLMTNDSSKTVEMYDDIFLYDDIKNDL